MGRPNGRFWTVGKVDKIKAEVRAFMNSQPQGTALKAALARLDELQDDVSSDGLLTRFVFCVSMLFYHKRFGGLTSRQIASLVEVATALVRAQLGLSKRGVAGDLLGELALIRSQIERGDGKHWRAAWNLELSGRYMDLADQNRGIVILMGRAVRLMRLGNVPDAVIACQQLADFSLTPDEQGWVALMQAQAKRFIHDFVSARAFIQAAKPHVANDSPVGEELAWECLLIDAQESGHLRELLMSVRPGKSHFTADRFLEAHLYVKASPHTTWLKDIALVQTRARSNDLAVHRQGTLYQAALCLEQCYDANIPLDARMSLLGDTLEKRDELPSVQQELAFLAAAYAWLIRSRSYPQAKMVGREYAALSLRLTGGAHDDALQVLSPDRHPAKLVA